MLEATGSNPVISTNLLIALQAPDQTRRLLFLDHGPWTAAPSVRFVPGWSSSLGCRAGKPRASRAYNSVFGSAGLLRASLGSCSLPPLPALPTPAPWPLTTDSQQGQDLPMIADMGHGRQRRVFVRHEGDAHSRS